MRSRALAVALLLCLAAIAAPTVAASGETESAGPCILTGLACAVIEIALVVAGAVVECAQTLDCIGN